MHASSNPNDMIFSEFSSILPEFENFLLQEKKFTLKEIQDP